MNYEGIVYRPPSEGESVIIQATIGCPHNCCNFCNMYKNKNFRIRKVEDILEDIEKAGQYYDPQYVRTLFLADGNTVVMRTDHLLRILKKIQDTFPYLERVTSYGSSQFIRRKSLEEWKDLHAAGLSRIHNGMETGHDPLLLKINKGSTMKDHIEGGQFIKEAGIELSMYYLSGLGGMEMWEGHARDSATVFNAVNPDFIRIRTYSPMPGTVMGDSYIEKKLKIMTPQQVLKELYLMVSLLEVNSHFYSDHWLNFANINGVLPKDKTMMLEGFNEALLLPPSAFRPIGMISDSL